MRSQQYGDGAIDKKFIRPDISLDHFIRCVACLLFYPPHRHISGGGGGNKALLVDNELSVEEVAVQVGVSPATLYRYFPGGRSGLSAG